MSMKRWLGFSLLFVIWLGVPRLAHATLHAETDPIDFGPVFTNATGTASTTIFTDVVGGNHLNHFDLSASGCTNFAVTPAAPDVQVTGVSGAVVGTLPITVTFSPSSLAPVTCTITMDSGAGNTPTGTFVVKGSGLAPSTLTIVPPNGPPVSFGSARLTANTTRAFTFKNTGDPTTTLTVQAPTFSGANPTEYSVTATTFPLALAGGTQKTVTIKFAPDTTGTLTANLDVTSNAAITPTQSIALTGVGTTAVINVTPTLAFGTVPDGTVSTMPISVSDTGNGTLKLTSASTNGTLSSFITFGTNPPDSCSGAATCDFTPDRSIDQGTPALIDIRCAPPNGASGTQMVTVTFLSDSDLGGTNTTTVSCTAGPPVMGVSPGSLDLGSSPVGTATAAKTFTISNTGAAALHYGITKSPSPSNEYALTGCTSGCTLAAGAMATVSVVFTPVAVGTDAVTVTVTGDDPVTPTSTVGLTGVGQGGIATITVPSPPTIAFGTIDVGSASSGHTVTITNTGNATLTVKNAGFGTANFEALTGTLGTQTTPLAPNGSVSWSVACSPTTFGPLSDNFTIASDGVGSASKAVALTCTGNAGALSITASDVNFGNVREGDIATVPVVLKNIGTAPVSLITDVFSSTTAGYSFTSTVPGSLNPGMTATINVQFAPDMTAIGGDVTVIFNGTATGGTTPATLTLHGHGLKPGFDVSPGTLDFGFIRFDKTATQTFTISNTDVVSFKVNAVSIAPDIATMTVSSELTVTSITHNGTAVTLPFTLPTMGDSLVVTVKCTPTARVGMLHATATVTSDLGSPNTTRTVDLKGTITAAMLVLTPGGGTFDFGGVDIDGAAATQVLTLANMGSGPLDISAITKMGGSSPAFTVVLPTTATTLQPLEHLDLTVTYKPTAVEADQLTLIAAVTGALPPAPNSASFVVSGHGTDRFIVAPAMVTFPATFRNPGTTAPVMPVTIHNSGEATLHVSAVMVDNPDYRLVGPTSADIVGGASFDFMVAFTPMMGGAAPVGHLTINNDDNTSPQTMMAVVLLGGVGIVPNVLLGPTNIEAGLTSVGVPITIPDILTITSMDPANAFTIASIGLTSDTPDQPFTIEQAPVAETLAPSETKTFSVTFTPTEEGDFTTTARLFIDQDPDSLNMITIHGHAVFVDAHGGGGCSTGGDRGGVLVLCGVLAFALRRRRRRAAGATGALVALVGVGLATPAWADNVDLTLFNPTPSTTGENFQLLAPDVGDNGDWVASGVVSYATNPLVLAAFDHGTKVMDDNAIKQRTLFELGGAYAFLDRFEAGARMPIYTQSGDTTPGFGASSTSGTATGDLTLHGKARLWRGPALGGALVAGLGLEVTLPTATDGRLTGVDGPSVRALALIGYTPQALGGRLSLSLNGGGVIRKRAEFLNVEQGSGFAWGAGASVRVLDNLWATGEVFGDLIPSGSTAEMGGKTSLSPIEALGGINYRITRGFTLGLAAGRGVTDGLGSPGLRGVFSLTFVSGAPAALVPDRPVQPPTAETDTDGDGIPDSRDRCPNEPEDFDMFDDEDGCPDPDNDGDGIPDKLDKCPLDPEDFDGFQDEDGCPDKDNDNDGIPDAIDKCPNEPEDKDGFEDLDGCPDPDNDHDGIPDVSDKCPNEAETINGFQDEDGCPDKGDGLVSLSPDRLELLEAVKFTGATIDKASSNVLAQIGATLRAHSEIIRVRVTVHVQPTKSPERDQELSDQRATAVRDWLVKWGVNTGRLEVRGFGGTKPLVPADQKGAKLVNNRLELIILERK